VGVLVGVGLLVGGCVGSKLKLKSYKQQQMEVALLAYDVPLKN
jgi:hypothetical protein